MTHDNEDYAPSATPWVREQVEKIIETGDTGSVGIDGMEVVLMTYRGLKSGLLRKTPVMRVEHDGSYAAVASMGGAPTNPTWYESVAASPTIEIQDGTETHTLSVREVSGEEKAQWWERAVAAFPPYAEYQTKTDRQIPVFVLDPVS